MDIRIYGKSDCALCETAKNEMKKMGLIYRYYDLESRDGDWKENGAVEAMAAYQYIGTLPIFCLEGDFMSYSEAMVELYEEEDGGHVPNQRQG